VRTQFLTYASVEPRGFILGTPLRRSNLDAHVKRSNLDTHVSGPV